MKTTMNRCYFGDCRETMRRLIAEGVKVQTCVTSPPYWGLRDYGHAGASIAYHKARHRIAGRDRILPGQENPVIQCACGCGTAMKKYDKLGRVRRYHEKHSFRKGTGKIHAIEMTFCACGCGSTFNKYDKYGRVRKYVSGHNGRT